MRKSTRGAGGFQDQCTQTVSMHCMSTTQHAALRRRVEKVLLANWTVLMHAALNAAVIISQLYRIAASTSVAVKELVTTPNSGMQQTQSRIRTRITVSTVV